MTPWQVIQSPTDAEMSAVQGAYLVADNLPIEDAHLIAAAPDLLASCLAAEDFLATIQTDAALAIYHQLHSAIAKARNTPALHVEVL